MTVKVALATESFTGVAANLGAPYTQAFSAPTLQKDGSGHGIGSTGGDCFAFDGGHTYSNDQYSSLSINSTGGSTFDSPQPAIRGSGAVDVPNCYFSAWDTGNFDLAKYVAGSGSDFGSVAGTYVVGDSIECWGIGSNISLLHNGVSILTVSDTSFASGKSGPGLGTDLAITIDNWEGGNLVSAGAVHSAPKVIRQKRRIRKGKTTQIKSKRQGNQARKPVKEPLIVKGRRRKPQRTVKTTLVVAKRKGNIAHPPRVSPIVIKGRRRKPQRSLKITLIRAKKSASPVNSAHSIPVLIVKSPKKRKRRLVSAVIVGAPRSSVPRRTKTLVLSKKRHSRRINTQILTALLAQPASPRVGGKPLIVVQKPKRRKRQGDTTLLRAVVSANKAVRPQKGLKVVAGRKKRHRVGNATQIKAPQQRSVSVRPSKTLFLVTAKKRKSRKTSVQKLSAKKSVVPVSGAPRAPLTVSLKRKHRKIQAKTTLLRAKLAGNQPITPPRPPKIVAGRRRRRRTGDVIQITGAKRAPLPSVRPVKTLFQILPKKRRKKRTASTIRVTGARRAPPVAPRRKPLIVRRPKARKQISRKKTLILLKALFSSPVVQFPAIITCFSGPSIRVVSKSREAIIVTSLSNDQTKLRAIQ